MGALLSGQCRPRRYFFFPRHQRFDARSERAAGRSQFGQIWPWLLDARIDRRDGQLATAAAGTIRRQPLSAGRHFDFSRKWRDTSKGDGKNMDSKSSRSARRGRGQKRYYERCMEKEGIPVVEGFGVTDVRNIQLTSWSGSAATGPICSFADWKVLPGFMSASSAPGDATSPRGIFMKKLFISYKAKAWRKSNSATGCRRIFSWRADSLFSPPMNTLHRLINYSERAGDVSGGHHGADGTGPLSQ